jgi:nuclear pore complex protein Nup155
VVSCIGAVIPSPRFSISSISSFLYFERPCCSNTMAAATPQRPLPGTYFNTPSFQRQQPNQALIRPPLFHVPSSSNAAEGQQQSSAVAPSSGSTSAAPAVQSLQPIERAARTINEMYTQDARFPQLENYVGRTCSKRH